MKPLYSAVCIAASLVTFIGCRTVTPRSPLVDENEDVRIEERKAAASWKTYIFKRKGGKELRQLMVDGKFLLRESDNNSDGQIDAVRVRLSDGRFVIIEDSDHDGEFDRVRKGP